MCVGWSILDVVYPVFQSTRHKKWLQAINNGLKKELIKRNHIRLKLIRSILLKTNILPTDIIQLIIGNMEHLKGLNMLY